jgi:uncharacterized oxidoreductase
MKLTGNTIFITGAGSGIGRGFAEALYKSDNQVIISGRRKAALSDMVTAHPGMKSVELDITNPTSIGAAAEKVIAEFPTLNVLINNAGIMLADHVEGVIDDAQVSSIVTTNLLGPIRMTSALIEHLKKQREAWVINVTSGLAFIPLANTATYSATKAALHSYTLSQRYLLRDTNVRVLEIAPPYVQTELMGQEQANDPRAMPLNEFIEETMQVLGTDADEVLTERVSFLRNGARPSDAGITAKFNEMAAGH